MPADWFSPILILLGTLAWPAAFIIAMWLFRKQIRAFINEISEFSGFGTKATRSGNQISKDLRQNALEDLEGVEPKNGGDDLVDDEADAYGVKNADKPTRPNNSLDTAPRVSADDGATKDELLRFVGDQIYQKLLNTRRQHATKSSAVSAELVRSAYSDLRFGVRYLGQHRLGGSAISGVNWPLASADSILSRLGAPQEQIVLMKQMRRLEEQVRDGDVRVDGIGAKDYIQTAIDVHIAVYLWAGVEVQPTRRRYDS